MLGDLGCLATGPRALTSAWADFGWRLHDAVSRPVALVPCPAERWARLPQGPWQRLPWERTARPIRRPDPPVADRAERLLRLVSPAIRIEPGLLRGVRRLLGPLEADAGTEADVSAAPGRHQHLQCRRHPRPRGGEAPPRALSRRRSRPSCAAACSSCCAAGARSCRRRFWFEEILNLGPASQALLAEASDLDEARRFLEVAEPSARRTAAMPSDIGSLGRRVERRLTDGAWRRSASLGRPCSRMWWIAHRADETPATQPPRFDPAYVSVGGCPAGCTSGNGRRLVVAAVGEHRSAASSARSTAATA